MAKTILVAFIITSYLAFSDAQFDVSLGNSTDHFANCTINNVVYYDDDCTQFIRRFITWFGFGLLLLAFFMCGCLWYCICTLCRVAFCNDRYNPRMFATRYPNYKTIP